MSKLRTTQAVALLVIICWALVAAEVAPASHTTNHNRWKKSDALGPSWDAPLNKAAQVWDHVWYQSHNFVRVTDTSYEIFHYKGLHDGPGGTLAVTVSWQSIKYDSEENWFFDTTTSDVPANKLDVWSIAAHENGHTLHIFDVQSCPSPTRTMCAFQSYGASWARSLEQPDREGIQNLYPCPSCRGF